MSKTYGTACVSGAKLEITGEPHMLLMCKRVFPQLGQQFGTLQPDNTPANVETLDWFRLRYPLVISPQDERFIRATVEDARNRREECGAICAGAVSLHLDTLLPLRSYQLEAVQVLQRIRGLLCGDDLGLGKTAVALGAMAAGLQPAVLVCKTHLQRQWVEEAAKFLAGVKAHVVKKWSPYPLPPHNLLIITYSKLAGWAETLQGYQLIAFDEMQELRCAGTQKGCAAAHLCEKTPYRLGLTATPVYNYGDEIFTLIELLSPGCLGARTEFNREWCDFTGKHHIVKEPAALGSFLAEQFVFLRRRRTEVGRELPAVTRISEEVEYDSEALLANEDKALELAKLVLRGEWTQRGQAARELDAMLRQQTGIAKAPFVADFVKQMVDSGEAVVLAGWHHEVYTVWGRAFERAGIRHVCYTGEESPTQKTAALKRFVDGEADVFVLSLRSGEGLNGLQRRATVIVFGELDWSPQVHEQCIGRLQRDEQCGPVTAVYLYAGGGSDPVIAQVLGIKRGQSEGIINPGADPGAAQFGPQANFSRASELAKAILKRNPARARQPLESEVCS